MSLGYSAGSGADVAPPFVPTSPSSYGEDAIGLRLSAAGSAAGGGRHRRHVRWSGREKSLRIHPNIRLTMCSRFTVGNRI
jgi:hypothetical protein